MEHFHPPTVMVKVFGRVPLELTSAAYEPTPSRNTVAKGGRHMAWTTPTLVEICIGLEINGYLPAEF
jgi:coenzyme PQQ precursor peptide PqqA